MSQAMTSSGKPLVDFDVYMAERMRFYTPVEDRGYEPRMTQSEIKSFFSEQKTIFADRTPEQEKKSFDAFFAFKDLERQGNTKEHFDALKALPAFENRSDQDLEKLASMRSVLQEGFEKKGVAQDVQRVMFEKFDRVYANVEAIDKAESILDVGYGARNKGSRDEGLSH